MKDYKKILEGVVNIINTTEKSDIGFANICTYIGEKCPELKESEDDKIRKRILLSLEKDLMATKNSGCNTQDLEQCIIWIKSLGNIDTQWKPNEKQLIALRRVKNAVGGEGELYNPLNQLYEDLIKL